MATVGRIGGETIMCSKRAMTTSEGKKRQQIIQNTLRLATCSELRRVILVSLGEGEKALSELREELEVSSTTAIHALRDLERYNFVFQDEHRDYALTKIGEMIALKLSDFVDAIEVLKKHEDFWLTHDLSGIPEQLLERIGWLNNSNVVKIDVLDIIKTHKTYIAFIETAKWIRGVSSIFSPDYPKVFEGLVKKTIDTRLILTENVWEKVIEVVGLENIRYQLSKGCLEIFIAEEDVKVAFTVTDAVLSLGLFALDGTYDNTCDLISNDERAVCWGVELFEQYQKGTMKYEI